MRYRKFLSYFGYPYVVDKSVSPFNGEIKVISLYGKYSISVDNLTQSGPIVEGLWFTALKRFKSASWRISFKNILVLGVGGGSVIKILRQYYPQVKITGVEIDKEMIEIAKKYFNLESFKADIIISDAFSYINKIKQGKFDLIIVDILTGRKIPPRIAAISFLKNLKKLLNSQGIIIFNRLRLKGFHNDIVFINTLKKVYPKVTINKPLVNTIIYCQNN